MAIKDYRVRYGTTWYEHREGDEAFPLPFRLELERAEGKVVRWGNGVDEVIDPDSPESSYRFLVETLHHGAGPDDTDRFYNDAPPSRIKF